ncbi:MAG: hypothetical protein WKF36_09400 [Candidatus Nitrosocosmicus sp.]
MQAATGIEKFGVKTEEEKKENDGIDINRYYSNSLFYFSLFKINSGKEL